jgi:hypothetical protein
MFLVFNVKSVPREIDGAQVVLFTVLDNRHRPTGQCRHEVGGIRVGQFLGLAICNYPDQDGYYLFRCDGNWNTVTDTFHESLDDAKAQAEFEYKGVSETWQMPDK